MNKTNKTILFCLMAILTITTWPLDFAEARPAHLRSQGARRIVKAVRTNTRQIFKPTFTIQSSLAGGMNDAQFSGDGRWFASASGNRSAQLWSMATGQRELNLSGHGGGVVAVQFIANSKEEDYGYKPQAQTKSDANRKGVLVTGSTDGEARLWSMVTGETIRTFKGHKKPITSLVVTSDGNHLITGSKDETAKLWNLKDGTLKRTFEGHEGAIIALALDPKGHRLATGSGDETIRIWDIPSGAQLQELDKYDGPIQTLAWSPNGQTLASGHKNGNLRLWTMLGGSGTQRLMDHDGAVYGVAFSPDSHSLASVGKDKIVRLWSLENEKPKKRFEGHQKEVQSVSFSQDSNLLLTASDDRTIRLWTLKTGSELARLVSMQTGWAVVTPDGRFDGTLDGDLEDRLDAIQWAGENHAFALDGFLERYYRPALLGRLLSKKEALKKVAAPQKEAPNVTEGFFLPPKVEIQKPNVSTSQTTIKLETKTEDMGGGIDEIRLYQNGKIIDPGKVKDKDTSTDGDKTITKTTFEVKLVDGENVFQIVGLSKDRIESEPHILSLQHQPEEQTSNPKLHVFVVGINEYANPALNLDFAVPDAKGMLDFFMISYAHLFKRITTYEIFDKKATRRAIDRELSDLYSAPERDTVILYFAGHGEAVEDSWYFIPHELNGTDAKAVQEQGVSSIRFKEHLSKVNAQKIVLLFDACKSGAAMNAFADFENQRSMALLSRSTGIHIATATTGKQYASELSDLGHGVFTYALLQGLQGKADRKPKDGDVSVVETLNFIKRYVPFLTNKYETGAMTPVVNSRGTNFTVAKKQK